MIVLITGGTGFLGQHVVPKLLENPQIERIRILSRNEHTQAELKEKWNGQPIDFFVGDIRDAYRVRRALDGVHHVYHFAASKRVESCEYNPDEAVDTNVRGTQNIIRAIWESDTVEKAIFTSTDKAVEPLNCYGMTKALAEKLWIQANIGKHRAKFSACRYGNVAGSHGSVIEKWKKQLKENKKITIVNGGMSRFLIHPEKAAEFVISCAARMDGAEVFIPKMKSVDLVELANYFADSQQQEIIPARPGEKKAEKLIADAEVHLVTQFSDKMIRWPEFNLFPVKKYGDPVTSVYSSETAERLNEEEIRHLIS